MLHLLHENEDTNRKKMKTSVKHCFINAVAEASVLQLQKFLYFWISLFSSLVKINLTASIESAGPTTRGSDLKTELQWHHPIHQLDLHLLKAVHYLLLVTNKCHSQPPQIPVGESRCWFQGLFRHMPPHTLRTACVDAAASAYLLPSVAPKAL